MHEGEKSNDKNLLTRRQAASYLGLKASTLAAWGSQGTRGLPTVKIGRLRHYRKCDLDTFIRRNLVTEAEQRVGS